MLPIDTLVRFEEQYVTLCGAREAGQTEENRAFFVPYDEVQFLKIDRAADVSEMDFYCTEWNRPTIAQPQPANPGSTTTPGPVGTPAPSAPPQDPTEIARQNRLDRIGRLAHWPAASVDEDGARTAAANRTPRVLARRHPPSGRPGRAKCRTGSRRFTAPGISGRRQSSSDR